jgi:recombination protein RecA
MIDAQKLKKAVHKQGFTTELADPTAWVSSSNYAMNFLLSGDFYRAIPNHRTTAIAGPQGSGKSLLIGDLLKNSQQSEPDRFIVYIDTEEAISEEHLTNIGVDMSEDKFMPIKADTVEEVTEIFNHILDNTDETDKLFIVLDSASNLETEKELESFNKGDLSNDMGLFPKKLKQLQKNFNKKVAKRDIVYMYSLHVYENQDVTNGKGKYVVSGGEAQLHVPSQTIMLDKLKLKEGSDVVGVRIKAQTLKNRFQQPFMQFTMEVPYNTGIDPYNGLLDFLEEEKLVTKNGAWYSFTDVNGESHKFQKKNISEYFDKIMEVWKSRGIETSDATDEDGNTVQSEQQVLEED